jgi:sugar O-acyltransferase (sialic acid O-acetyltransferase NeuD family)
VILFGGGGHAKMLIDLLQAEGKYRIEGILDDGKSPGTLVLGISILGGKDLLPRLYQSGLRLAINAVGGIGNVQTRMVVSNFLEETGFTLPPVRHPSSLVETSAQLANGCQVFAKAYVGAEARVGKGAIASTGCIISHDCILEDYAIVSPGAILAGEVTIGAGALVGMGATINLRVNVGAGAKIGNSAIIKDDVPAGWVVQAGASWPK